MTLPGRPQWKSFYSFSLLLLNPPTNASLQLSFSPATVPKKRSPPPSLKSLSIFIFFFSLAHLISSSDHALKLHHSTYLYLVSSCSISHLLLRDVSLSTTTMASWWWLPHIQAARLLQKEVFPVQKWKIFNSPGWCPQRGLQICPSSVDFTSVRNMNTRAKRKCE